MNPGDHDWNAVRLTFFKSLKVTVKDVSLAHDIPYPTCAQHIYRHHWKEERDKLFADNTEKAITEWLQRDYVEKKNRLEALGELIDRVRSDPDAKVSGRDLVEAVRLLNEMLGEAKPKPEAGTVNIVIGTPVQMNFPEAKEFGGDISQLIEGKPEVAGIPRPIERTENGDG